MWGKQWRQCWGSPSRIAEVAPSYTTGAEGPGDRRSRRLLKNEGYPLSRRSLKNGGYPLYRRSEDVTEGDPVSRRSPEDTEGPRRQTEVNR